MTLFAFQPVEGPVSLENVSAMMRAFSEGKILAGVMMLFALIMIAFVVSNIRSQTRSSEQLLAVATRATEAMGVMAAAVSEARRSSEATTAEMRSGFAETKAELRILEKTIDAADGAREALKDLVIDEAERVIGEVRSARCAAAERMVDERKRIS